MVEKKLKIAPLPLKTLAIAIDFRRNLQLLRLAAEASSFVGQGKLILNSPLRGCLRSFFLGRLARDLFAQSRYAVGYAGSLILIISIHIQPTKTEASTGEIYGYGSKASAGGNTLFSGSQDAFATYYCPAANSLNQGFLFNIGMMWLKPRFFPISNVVIDNQVANKNQSSDAVGDVNTNDYNDQIAQILAASYNFGDRWKHLTLGITAALPLDRIAYMDSGQTFKPEYFGYRSRTQRPQIYGALSLQPFPQFSLGLGLAVATNMSANATLIVTSPPSGGGASNSVSSGRFAASLRPSLSPYFSAMYLPDFMQWALTIRLPNRYKSSLDTGADAKVLGAAGSFSMVLNSASSLYYDPLEFDLGIKKPLSENSQIVFEVDFLQYKKFESPTLKLTNQSGGTISIVDTPSNLPKMRNIWVPKIGWEQKLNHLTYRLGVVFRPSPVKSNADAGNLVDPDQWIATGGLGFNLEKLGITTHHIQLDAHVQFHYLVKKRINKSPGDELGTVGREKIGSPGYDIGGTIWGGGLSATVEL